MTFSCGSLAPKLVAKPGQHGGCMNCLVFRDKEPRESSDGAVRLLREMSSIGTSFLFYTCYELCVKHLKPWHLWWNVLENC